MTTFTFAHISDLHFSSGAYIGGNHKHSIRRLLGIESLLRGKKFDRVIVTGDISNAGDEESLLRANTWLFERLKVDADHSTGLELDPASTLIVPGNHDAFNSKGHYETHIKLWQSSLENYNRLFPLHTYLHPETIRYDWLTKDGVSAFLVGADTCYLGDQQPEGVPGYEYALKGIPDMARGDLSLEQSSQLLSCFELGTRGKLLLPHGEGYIPAEAFSSSLKVFIAHHYLFEAPGQRIKPHLQLKARRSVFTNLASCEIDLYLCGHKHQASVWPTTYAQNLPKRERTRYLLNVFRRLVGLTGLPVQVRDKKGRKMDRAQILMLALISKMLPIVASEPGESEAINSAYIKKVFEVLRQGLDDPGRFEKEMHRLLKSYGIPQDDVLAPGELRELALQIKGTLSTQERAQLKKVSRYIEKAAKNLTCRPFVQVVCGSSAKATGSTEKERSVNIYEVEIHKGGFLVEAQKYLWDSVAEEFGPNPVCRQHFFPLERHSHSAPASLGR